MTDTTIACFLSVCGTLNFTRTAQQLHLSQQAVSKQIMSLEAELGYKLFYRGYHSITLTKIGGLYRDLFLQWERQLQDTKNKAKRMYASDIRIVRIAYLKRIALPDAFNNLIYTFKEAYPQVAIEYSQITGSDMVTLLSDGVVDFCIGHQQLFSDAQGLCSHPIELEEKYLSISRRHPQYCWPLPPEAIKDMTYLFTPMEDQDFEAAVANAKAELACLGALPGAYKMVKDDDALYLSVEMGEGVTLSSNVTKLFQNPSIDSVPLHLQSYLSVCWNPKNENPYVQKISQMVKQIKLPQSP